MIGPCGRVIAGNTRTRRFGIVPEQRLCRGDLFFVRRLVNDDISDVPRSATCPCNHQNKPLFVEMLLGFRKLSDRKGFGNQ